MEQIFPLQEHLAHLTQQMNSAYNAENSGIVSYYINDNKSCEMAFAGVVNVDLNKYNQMAYRILNSGKPVCVINKCVEDIIATNKHEAFDAFAIMNNERIYLFFVFAEKSALQTKKLAAKACICEALYTENEDLLIKANAKIGNTEKYLMEYSKISHDFKTPINIIQASIQILVIKLLKEDVLRYESTYKQILNMAQANVFKLSRLTGNLLDCVRAENGKMELLLSYDSIVECVNNTIVQMRAFAAEKQIQLVVKSKIDSDKKFIFDTVKLDRILINLLSNSITAIIESENKKGKITVSIEEDEKDIILSVTDNGKGILKQNADKIFESFYTGNKKGGSGLGLSVVKALTELHNGSVKLERLKKGVRFIVRLSKNIQSSGSDMLLSSAVDYGLHTTDEFVAIELAYLKNYFSEQN